MVTVDLLKVAVLVSACCFAAAERKSYEGYQEWTVYAKTRDQMDFLHDLDQLGEIDATVFKMADAPIRMMIAPEKVHKYKAFFKARGIKVVVQDSNIQRSLEDTYKRIDARLDYDPNDYNSYADIQTELQRLAGVCDESVTCSVDVLGQSVEGRDITVFHMTKEGADRRGHFVDSLIHAREWLAGATLMRILDYMVTVYGEDDDVTRLVDTYDFHFVPIVNPDGYEYTNSDRFWRKSRNENDGSGCIGTDLNRNYEYEWGGVGSSTSACNDLYRGSGPASEPEIQVMQREAGRLADSLLSYVSIHTTAYVWLSPYGWSDDFSCNDPDDLDDIQQVGDAAVRAIEDTSGDNWTAGTACRILYAANGVTVDYTYSLGIKYSYTPELRCPGFNPPPSAIEPSFQEIWNGYKAMIAEIEVIEGL